MAITQAQEEFVSRYRAHMAKAGAYDSLTQYVKGLGPRDLRDCLSIHFDVSKDYVGKLPGAHPLLENFKLIHRAVDVKKPQAETRKLELENLRYAGRLLDEEFQDPEIDRKIQITGAAPAVVVPPEV